MEGTFARRAPGAPGIQINSGCLCHCFTPFILSLGVVFTNAKAQVIHA